MNRPLFEAIRAGSIVTIETPHGSKVKGRAVMFNPALDIWVLNAGGRYGTPALASHRNTINVRNKVDRKTK